MNRKRPILVLSIILICLVLWILSMLIHGTRDLMTPEEALRANYGAEGITAGQHQFRDYWARDSLYASWGALALGDDAIVKKNLDLFRRHQKTDGQVPLRIGKKNMLRHFLGLETGRRVPVYREDKEGNTPLDQNCLYIITSGRYLEKHPDERDELLPSLRLAHAWLSGKDTDGNHLVEEGSYAGWTDSLRKQGEVLYTNVCYYQATEVLSRHDETYKEKAGNIKKAINTEFWLEDGYYADFIDQGEPFPRFSTEANLLAILWDVADEERAAAIQSFIEENKLRSPIGILNTDKPYPLSRQSFWITFAGMGDYHDGLYWGWIGSLDAVVLHRMGREAEAREVLADQEELYRTHLMVFEVYDEKGRPIDRLFYEAEHPFAWNAGMHVWAEGIINN